MNRQLLHTPEGVRDIYGAEYQKKNMVLMQMLKVFQSFGYKSIQTPMFEFFDVFSREIGTTKSNELYKFFDKEGNTLVLRPDFTPSMARCAAKYFMEETIPVRFTYAGNTFTNTSNLQGKLKEVTQTGVELIGDEALEADAEIIHLAVLALKSSGLKEFQISIGEIEFFKGLCEEAGLNEDLISEVRELISNKNYFGVEEKMLDGGISRERVNVFLKVSELFGSVDCLSEARKFVQNEKSLAAILRLEQLYKILKEFGDEKYISFDLGQVSKYNYYTGIIFKAYTYGVGDAILKGGRYDKLLGCFGKPSAAVGFMVIIDDLMVALESQLLAPHCPPYIYYVLYEKSAYTTAVGLASKMREAGKCVECVLRKSDKKLEDYLTFGRNNLVIRLHYVAENGQITEYETAEEIK